MHIGKITDAPIPDEDTTIAKFALDCIDKIPVNFTSMRLFICSSMNDNMTTILCGFEDEIMLCGFILE